MQIPQAMRAAHQWVLWKLEKRDGKATKVPYQVNGRMASSTDPAHWSSFEAVQQVLQANLDTYTGCGFVFAPGDDFVGIDLDNCMDTDWQLDDWAKDVLAHLPSYAEVSPSGKGLKIFCLGRPNCAKGRKLQIPGKPGARIEIYSSGRYFTVTGDQWGSVDQVQNCQPGIDWLTDVVIPPEPAAAARPAPLPRQEPRPYQPGRPDAEQRARLYAQSYPAAISGQDGHGVTFRLACVLVTGFELGIDGARQILADWNQGCQPPWSDRELEHKLRHAENAGRLEGSQGWMLEEESIRLEQSAEPLSQTELDRWDVYLGGLMAQAQQESHSRDFPAHLLKVPGFCSDVADWITSQNPRKNRVLSLVAAVALQGALIGGKCKDRAGSRSNLYFVCLAPSGGGKQAPQTCVKKILNAIGAGQLYGGKVSSDSALASDLLVSRSKLYLWDEVGRFIAKTKVQTGGAHLHAVQEALLELWGEAGGVWKQKSYADSKNNKEVYLPCCSFLGMTVPEHFWAGLEEGHLQDGFAARMMVIDSGPKARSEDIEETNPPMGILELADYWMKLSPGGNLGSQWPDAILVPESPAATDAFRQLVAKAEDAGTDETENAVWARCIEKARRLALIYACSRDHVAPVIDDLAARWGIDFDTWCTERFIAVAKDEVASSDPAQQKWQRIRKIVNEWTKRKQLCSRTALIRACKWTAKDLDKILETMVQAGVIEAKQVPSSNGKFVTYYSVKG
ncbi:MAG: hypothetical protein ACK5XN_31920 [Bacteroidota bacterium]